MIAIYREAKIGMRLDLAIPRDATVFEEWSAFVDAAPSSDCLVVAFDRVETPCSEEALRYLGGLQHPPLIIVMPAVAENLHTLARITCYDCVLTEQANTHLPAAIDRALAESPRLQAANAIMDRFKHEPFVQRLVAEVLAAREPVKDERALVQRLDRQAKELRTLWSLVVARGAFPLYRLIRWGRFLRTLERLAAGGSIRDVAVELDVDESTIYRDFLTLTETHTVRPPVTLRQAVAMLARELDGAREFEKD
ncbi:MAG: hypothetical protein ACRD5G_00400 [Candidatus Acidiferrales bacterium]